MLVPHVKHFLGFFGGRTAPRTFCWMNGTTSKVIKGRGVVYGQFKDIAKWEREIGEEDLPTLHITLNETDLAGRRRGNIKAYRVLCCDIDRKITEEELLEIHQEYRVQMVVKSSSGKYHLYWQLERGSDMELWRKLQLGIASKLDADLQLSMPTAMIRVPGFARIAKDGKKQMCSVMAFREDNEVRPLTVKQIVKQWPWIWEESEKGEQTLLENRKKAAKIARELMKARGKPYDSNKFARMTPDAGRNNTVYLCIYDIVYTHEDKLSYESVIPYGEDLNSEFDNPLESAELHKTIKSAWSHGWRARMSKVREQRKLVDMLEKKSADSDKKEKEKAAASVSKIIVDTILGGDIRVPESYLDISDILVSRLWTMEGLASRDQVSNHNVLVSAYQTKYYKKLTEFLIKALKTCGAFKVSGYSVYLKGVNEAGAPVRYRKSLDQDSLSALVQDILSRLYLHTVKVSLNGDGGGKGGKSLVSYLEQKDKPNAKKEKGKKNKAKRHPEVHGHKADGGSDQG